jgi:lipopolysaccharide/colanic/teichoic acid biosynthesis glycosyltransferase
MSNPAFALVHVGENTPACRSCFYAWLKRPLDCVFALVGLGFSVPIIAVAAFFVKLTSRGPVFYSQVRLGLGGRPFRLYKIRTMYHDSEAKTGPCWSIKGDPRITSIGRFLRWSHVDELPQMWNILTGDMSLIGPRPERPEMVPNLELAIPRYRRRLLVRPGLTGLAQVQLPPDTDLNSVRRKLAQDLCYLERFSFALDCRIFFATFGHVLGLSHERTTLLFALPRVKVVEKREEPRREQGEAHISGAKAGGAKAVVVADLQTV